MLDRRPIAALATVVSGLLVGALALSGCSATPSRPILTLGNTIPGGAHPTVAVIGDSIESGYGLEAADAWPALVAVDRRWGLANLSVPGAGFLAVGSDNADFTAQVDRAIAAKADLVMIGASDNDLGEDTGKVAAAMKAAVDKLHDDLPHARIIGFNALSGSAGDSDLKPLNDALHSAVLAAGGRWMEIGEPYRGQYGLVQGDGEHPTIAGQQAIASIVLADLDTVVRARTVS